MSKNYTWDDVPNTLNSISWQLKCIAEALDDMNHRQAAQEPKIEQSQPLSFESTKLRSLLKDLNK